MKITQADIASLDDLAVKRLTVELYAAAETASPAARLCRVFAAALVAAMRERRRLVAQAELEMINDDGPGALVGPDDDPVADALDQLRRSAREAE